MSRSASHPEGASQDRQGPRPDLGHPDQQRGASGPDNTTAEPAGIPVLAALSRHSRRSVRFVYNALAAVVRNRLPIAGWGESDYASVAVLARALEDGALPLEALVWDPACGWSREKALVAPAVCAHMADEWRRAMASGDEDAEIYAANDHACLRDILRLGDRENPFAAFDEI